LFQSSQSAHSGNRVFSRAICDQAIFEAAGSNPESKSGGET
jgi:hypothetical protein